MLEHVVLDGLGHFGVRYYSVSAPVGSLALSEEASVVLLDRVVKLLVLTRRVAHALHRCVLGWKDVLLARQV